jgi:hypothetical protein
MSHVNQVQYSKNRLRSVVQFFFPVNRVGVRTPASAYLDSAPVYNHLLSYKNREGHVWLMRCYYNLNLVI